MSAQNPWPEGGLIPCCAGMPKTRKPKPKSRRVIAIAASKKARQVLPSLAWDAPGPKPLREGAAELPTWSWRVSLPPNPRRKPAATLRQRPSRHAASALACHSHLFHLSLPLPSSSPPSSSSRHLLQLALSLPRTECTADYRPHGHRPERVWDFRARLCVRAMCMSISSHICCSYSASVI